MTRIQLALVVCAALALAACSGGGGGGGTPAKTVVSESSTYNGALRTTVTTYSDGTTSTSQMTGTAGIPSYSADGTQEFIPYTYKDSLWSLPNIVTQSGTPGAATYASDKNGTPCTTSNCIAYVVFSFPDGSTRPGAISGTSFLSQHASNANGAACTAAKCDLYVNYIFLAPFSGSIPNYIVFSETGTPGVAHYGTDANGSPCTVTVCIQYISFTYSSGLIANYTAQLSATGSTPTWASDHVTETITYTFANGATFASAPAVIEPTVSTAPTLTQAVYPTDWATGTSRGIVQKPNVTAASGTYGDGVAYSVDGSATKPFRQATLTPNGATGTGAINDPNAFVAAPTKGIYDLRWGMPDPAGSGYAASYTNGIHTFPQNYNWFGHTLASYCSAPSCTSPLTIVQPSQDVLDALNKGWTGKGSNVLIWDSFIASQNAHPSNEDYHGAITSLLAWRYAPGSNFYALDAFYGTTAVFSNGSVIDSTGAKQTAYTANPNSNNPKRQNSAFYMDVVNMSFGWEYQKNNRSLPQQQSDATNFINSVSTGINTFANLLNGTTATSALGNALTSGSAPLSFADTVITVAAGNEAIRSDWAPLPYIFAHDADLGPRTLIVGALDGTGTPGANGKAGTASIYASYVTTDPTTNKQITQGSNLAGSDLTVQGRFLVASGISPSTTTINGQTINGISIDGTPTSSYWGTSYAAPRVAGYASVVRQKFPNLTAVNTADILLATARYDTLSCYPNCDKAIYGQGEASLSRALAPVGYLR